MNINKSKLIKPVPSKKEWLEPQMKKLNIKETKSGSNIDIEIIGLTGPS
jgi:hypothetical protein